MPRIESTRGLAAAPVNDNLSSGARAAEVLRNVRQRPTPSVSKDDPDVARWTNELFAEAQRAGPKAMKSMGHPSAK